MAADNTENNGKAIYISVTNYLININFVSISTFSGSRKSIVMRYYWQEAWFARYSLHWPSKMAVN